jgi:hypothetical protein
MSKLLGVGLTVAVLSCTGCFMTSPDKLAPPPVDAMALRSIAPITADQVTAENRHQIAQALAEEMDRESKETLLKWETGKR